MYTSQGKGFDENRQPYLGMYVGIILCRNGDGCHTNCFVHHTKRKRHHHREKMCVVKIGPLGQKTVI